MSTAGRAVGSLERQGTCTLIADMDRRRLLLAQADGVEHELSHELPPRVRPWVRTNESDGQGHHVSLSMYRAPV